MLKVGDKVKINYDNLDIDELDNGVDGVKYSHYIWNNMDKVYTITDLVDCTCPYVLDGFLNPTSFSEDELIIITGNRM